MASSFAAVFGCDGSPEAGSALETATRDWSCIAESDSPEFLDEIGCIDDFTALASRPIDPSIPGARSVKTSIDRDDEMALSFQNSTIYPMHWDFLYQHRSIAQGLPRVPELGEFNASEYYSPSRRFILGALTHYEGPQQWVYEVAPADTASAEMIEEAYRLIAKHSYVGSDLLFHATSQEVELVADSLPADVPIITNDELFRNIDYQPLNPAESIGQLRFLNVSELETEYLSFRDIVVLDRVPNDIAATQGIITEQFQTTLSHLNVLSQSRGTPNMALRQATQNERLRSLEGKWVRLNVGLSEYRVDEVTQEEADTWWNEHKPAAVQVPGLDLDTTELRDCSQMIDPNTDDLLAEFKSATRAFGGKAANYAGLTHIEGLSVPTAFGIPVYFYMQFMEENGFDQRVRDLLADESFQNDAEIRDSALEQLRNDMIEAPVNATFEADLGAKLKAEFDGIRMRFRSSTNAEDLDGFTGAGLYTSKSASADDPNDLPVDAIKEVWSSIWYFRAFEERSYRSIDHLAVGMAILVHHSFPDEEANGVALTGNPFDKTGISPAFYVNVQYGETSVVQHEPGVTNDEFLYFFDQPGQPTSYIGQSNQVESGEHVLSNTQVRELGVALDAIRTFFAPAYQQSPWWAMDVEFKFDGEPGERPTLFVKQARPFGNR